jgi:hypothetical protein
VTVPSKWRGSRPAPGSSLLRCTQNSLEVLTPLRNTFESEALVGPPSAPILALNAATLPSRVAKPAVSGTLRMRHVGSGTWRAEGRAGEGISVPR